MTTSQTASQISPYNQMPKKPRKKKVSFEESIRPQIQEDHFRVVAASLAKQIDKVVFDRKYAPVKDVLKLVGVGAFIAGSLTIPALPLALKPFISNTKDPEAWKRFNIPYLKRALDRLNKQRLIRLRLENGMETVEITEQGKKKILKCAIDELAIQKPAHWDKTWRIICYDIPRQEQKFRDVFREYLTVWGCYPLQESVFLHAYPCEHEVSFLRDCLGISDYVRIFIVSKMENDEPFRQFFGI